jgi:hypothetical protein
LPKINRFRIVNFRYDDDRKYIANEIYEFDTKNSLINLENGGGKSVILQLALQVVLPNTNMGSRRFSDYFKVGASPTHILVEWKLDGTMGEYLLTGICVSKNADGIRFFTYTYNYALPHELDIKSIEVINSDKQVVGFSEFYNYLRRLSSERRFNINIFSRDRQREYRDKISTFRIYREEFEAIKTINMSEGGIDKFFENVKKSRSVIEKLIIPNIPAPEGESTGILAEAFKKHLENLKNIPVYQHRIKTYEAFYNKATGLLLKLEDYGREVEEINNISRDILALENIISIAADKLSKECEALNKDNEECLQKIEELSYKKESLIYQKKVNEMENLKARHEKTNKEVAKKREELLNCERKIKFIESVFCYREMSDYKNKILDLAARLETVSKDRSRIEEEYQNLIYHGKRLLTEKIKMLREKICSLEEKHKSQIKERDSLNIRLVEKNKERDNVRDILSSIGTRLKDLKERQDKITGYFAKDITLLVDGDEGLKRLLDEKENLAKDVKKLKETIENAKKKTEDINTMVLRKREALAEYSEKKKNIERDILQYSEKLSKINNEISMYEVKADVYSDEAFEALRAKKLKLDNQAGDVLGRYHELIKRKCLFEGSDYYIPDMEIKKVYELLKERDINCIPGSLWLKNQDEGLRYELLHKNPLLCHSIIVQKDQLELINNMSSEIFELVENYPVAFIVDSPEGIITGKKENKMIKGIDRLEGTECYIVFSKNSVFSVETDKFKEYLKSLDVKIKDTHNQHRLIKEDTERITGLLERCSEFKNTYPENYLLENEKKLEYLKSDIKKEENELKQLEEKKTEYNDLIDKSNREILSKEKLISEKEEDIKNLKEYIENTNKMNELSKEREKEENNKREIENKINTIKEKINKLSEDIEETRDDLKDTKRDEQENIKTLNEISLKLNIEKETKEIKGTLEEILSRAKGLEKKVEDSEAEQIQETIKSYQKEEENRLKRIHANGFCEKDFEGLSVTYSEGEPEEAKYKCEEIKNEIEILNSKERELSLELAMQKGRTEEFKQGIIEKYNLEPFVFECLESVSEETYNKSIDSYNRRKSKNLKKLEETEKRKTKLLELKNRIKDYINSNDIRIKADSRQNMDSFLYRDETVSMWDMLKLPAENIEFIYKNFREKYKELTEKLKKSKADIEENYDNLYKESDWAENTTVRMILENIIKKDMYNYTFVKELFEDMLESVENMKKATNFQLEESLRDKEEIIERCYLKAEAVYEELKLVDGFSKIKIGEKSRKSVIIEMPPLIKEEGKALMTQYIESSISEIEKMKEEGKYDPAKIDGEIERLMSPVRLLDAVTDLNKYSIKVFKPEAVIEASRYIRWEVVTDWSGGEKLAGFFAMFISIISYLRYKKTGWRESSKVIWIDNPFGQANANHLLSYIFDLARATNTQMICLTGHLQADIYMQFDVVYSLVHRMLTGMNMSVIQSKQVKAPEGLESAFYKVEREQMSLF